MLSVDAILHAMASPTVLLSLSVVGVSVLYIQWKRSRSASKIHALAETIPILGDLVAFLQNEDRFHDWLSDKSLEFHGKPWRLSLIGQVDTIVVSTPDAFEDVLVTQFDNFTCGETQAALLDTLFGKSIITFDGEEWYRQRKTATKFFTARALRTCMLKTMHKNVNQMYQVLDDAIDQSVPVDLSTLLYQFTLQTFAEVGLGVNFRWIGAGDSNPLEGIARVVSPVTMRRYRLPMFYWKLERMLNLGPEREMAKAAAQVRAWFRSVITQSMDELTKRQASRTETPDEQDEIKSVVELFVEHSHEDKAGLRLDDMVDFLLTFVLAAQDTSALTLGWFFWCMTQHPRVEERIRQEMAEVLPSMAVTPDTYLTTDHVHKLVYLEATIREVLRLYPTVPLMQKEADEAAVICGDIPLAKGEMVLLSMFAMARNPDVWGPDADTFKPERWINEKTGELRSVPASKFASFSTGPRVCVGMKLAMVELHVVAANLLRKYRFGLASPNDGSYNVAVTLLMKSPLNVNVSRAYPSVA